MDPFNRSLTGRGAGPTARERSNFATGNKKAAPIAALGTFSRGFPLIWQPGHLVLPAFPLCIGRKLFQRAGS